MKYLITIVSLLAILLCVLSAGCTSSSGTEAPATPVATALPTTEPTSAPVIIATPSAVPTTEPIQIMPNGREVNLLLTKDRPTSEIHLQYQGGPGERLVNSIIMRVYNTEGTYTEYVMSDGKKPIPGDEIVTPGTKGTDRCEVFVISAGTRFKVMDEPALGGGYY
ncbi:MAG: hypothetical protein ACYDDV_05585 [Methanoregula sp.]